MVPMQQIIKSFNMTDSLGGDHLFVNTLNEDKDPESKRTGFFEVLYSGKHTLMTKHKVIFIEADFEGAYNSGRKYDELRKEPSKYFLLMPDDRFVELKRGKKGVLKSLEDDGNLADVVKKEKLDLKSEADIIRLIEIMENK